MATGESQKQLISIIRNFASEKSISDRRVSDLKKRLIEARNDYDAANAELERTKQAKEVAEQELRGLQVQALMTDASIQAQRTRISQLQAEISKASSNLDGVKKEEGDDRDDFIKQMCDFNKKIRQLQDAISLTIQKQLTPRLSLGDGKRIFDSEEALNGQDSLKCLEDKIIFLDAHLDELEADYLRELLDHGKVKEELTHIKPREEALSKIIEEAKQLQGLRQQIDELEKVYASLGQELQNKLVCAACGSKNIAE